MLEWRGEIVKDKVLRATERAGNSILGDCVMEAKDRVPVRTSILQGSIQMRPMTMIESRAMAGAFGSWAVDYAIWVERGTKPHWPPIDAIEKGMKVEHNVAFLIALAISRRGTKPHPYLQPAADTYFPQFARRIKEEMSRG